VARGSKGNKGQYFTPRHVVEFCVRVLDPQSGERVIDPACGSGAFLAHTAQHRAAQHRAPNRGDVVDDALWGVDFDPVAVRVARAVLHAGLGTRAHLACGNSLLPHDDSTHLDVRDGSFDVVLTNPPFAGDVRERAILDAYPVTHGKDHAERDVLFVQRCVQLLRAGGRYAIVLPHNKGAGDAYAPLREWLLTTTRVVAVTALPPNTFRPHTSQRCSVWFGIKRDEPALHVDEPVCFLKSEVDSKNAQGKPVWRSDAPPRGPLWTRVQHDLDDVVTQLHAFCTTHHIPLRGGA
jgi:type I restriction enzyme M protein